MTVIDWDRKNVLNYLGTYFPRSYAEAYCITDDFFSENRPLILDKESLSILDFGCGTGGEIVGVITQLIKHNKRLNTVNVYALDGNFHALRLCESVLNRFADKIDITIKTIPIPITIEDFYDMSVLKDVLTTESDMIITFKAVCEFVTKERFEEYNAYGQIIKTLLPKMNHNGIMLLVDVTSYSDVSKEWLPQMMDAGVKSVPCRLIHQNKGYNQPIFVTHSHKTNDVSKVAWRIITH